MSLWLILAAIVLFVLLIVLEGRRQSRKLGAGHKSSGRGGTLMGVGILELQGHLQPDRKVEVIQQDLRDADRINPIYRPGQSGDDDGEEKKGGAK